MAALDAHPENDLRNIFEKSPHGIVIKPNSGAGSRDVHSIQSEQDLQSLELTPDSYLVEQRFAGPEYSVESISWEGSHQPLVVTEKTTGGTNGLVETGHLQPAQIPDEHRDRLFDAVRTVLDHAGYQTGLSHIEFILEEGQPRLIEAWTVSSCFDRRTLFPQAARSAADDSVSVRSKNDSIARAGIS
ncbi:ATP-grasp domain-containing protein [Brevibacterium sp. FAM 27836]|uniref:ATP-grasp domain-containing protein n=1 Tax=Brevibacterium sp. FAM 27836 TaxID=3446693 RepID=UPI003F512781